MPETLPRMMEVGDAIRAAQAHWTFGGDVPQAFETHAAKSIPYYADGHALIGRVSDHFVGSQSVCYDLGASTGRLLRSLAERNLVHVTMSITTLDHQVSRYLEPRTTAPLRRLLTIKRLADAGIPVGINVAPVVPFLTDHELEVLLEAGREMGASTAGYILLRLPWELKEVFRNWLLHHFPLKAAHVMSRVQEMRGGRDNDPQFGSRMTGEGIFADLLAQRFAKACHRLDLNNRGRRDMRRLDTSQFAIPGQSVQGTLFT